MLFFLVIIFVALIVLGLIYHQHRKKQGDNSDLKVPNEDEWLGNSSVFRSDIKMLSYNDALEESKQFIYNIAKIVMQRFAPDQKNVVLNLGRKLLNAGIKYVHVVDVFALSLNKKMSRFQSPDKKNKSAAPRR